ncbi:MAG: glycosyltransferase family 2 protein [Actinomycetota bacterium]|nr:glycosyltransferase family 2 protein [Actinomycetota bacterium]
MRRPRAAEAVCAGSALLVVYTFVGYPAIIALLARMRPRPVRTDPAATPRVTVIVVAHNEQDLIEGKLRDTLRLDYPPHRLEVVAVCDGSDDDTAARAARVEGVTVLYEPERRGKLAAMNRAFDATDGDVVVFSDANNRYSANTLRELVAPLADPAVGVVTGRKGIDDGSGRPLDQAEGLYWRYESKIKAWESTFGSVSAAVGEMLAFRRQAYQRPAPGMLTEDLAQVMLAAAEGWRVIYAPDAISLERASTTIDDEAIRRARLMAGAWQATWKVLPRLARRRPVLAWQLASHKVTRPVVPWALLAIAVSTLRLAPRSRWARWIGAAQAAFYAVALAGRRCERSGRRNRWLYLPYYFCRMNLAAVTGTWMFLAEDTGGVWERVPRG